MIKPTTDRLIMRQWRKADRPPFAKLNADPRVMQYFPDLLNKKMSDAMVDRLSDHIAQRGWGLWALEEKQSGDFIGFVGLHVPVVVLPFSPCVEIGWRLARDYWGKGYAIEAAKAALNFGFDQVNLDEVVSYTPVNNLRSRAVMLRLQMQESSDQFEHPSIADAHPLKRHCLYVISQQQWEITDYARRV